MTKDVLYKKVIKPVREKYIRYHCDEIARNSGKGLEVLRLPPHNCDLNPIEEIWSQVKGNIGKQNLSLNTYKIDDVERLANAELDRTPVDLWQACVRHAHEIEEEYIVKDGLVYDRDGLTLSAIKPVVISLEDDEEYWSSDDEEDDDDQYDDDSGSDSDSDEL